MTADPYKTSKLRSLLEGHSPWFAHKRFISPSEGTGGMGFGAEDHIANFAEPRDCELAVLAVESAGAFIDENEELLAKLEESESQVSRLADNAESWRRQAQLLAQRLKELEQPKKTNITLADDLFKFVDVRMREPEERLWREVEFMLDDTEFSLVRLTWDYYDCSVEVYTDAVEDIPVDFTPQRLFDAGFALV